MLWLRKKLPVAPVCLVLQTTTIAREEKSAKAAPDCSVPQTIMTQKEEKLAAVRQDFWEAHRTMTPRDVKWGLLSQDPLAQITTMPKGTELAKPSLDSLQVKKQNCMISRIAFTELFP
jgi:hypothetical protein